jgi:superfamily II DNA/RNA helicase
MIPGVRVEIHGDVHGYGRTGDHENKGEVVWFFHVK